MFGKKLSNRDTRAPFELELGIEAKDSITGYTGKLIGVTRWITGCDQYAIQKPVDEKGDVPEMKWFDESRITGVPAALNGGDVSNCPKPTSR